MSGLAFTDQKERLRRIVSNALDGAAYDGSRLEEDGTHLLIEAHRPGGQLVSVSFRAIQDSEATEMPAQGSTLQLESVGSARFSLWNLLFFFLPRSTNKLRVRIRAGDAKLDIVCEDAEWWED